MLLTYIGMLCQGKPQYEAVREMMDDPDYYKYALGISYTIPSAETLRQRFDMIGIPCAKTSSRQMSTCCVKCT